MTFRKNRSLLAGGLLAALTLLATPWPAAAADAPKPADPPKPAAPAPPASYKLQPGDEIKVSVVPQKEFDTAGTILPDGKVSLPGIGELDAAGLRTADLAKEITKILDKDLVDPKVTVSILKILKPQAIPKVTVVGAVGKPGPIDLDTGLRLRKAIELAGGVTADADKAKIRLTHADASSRIVDLDALASTQDATKDPVLLDGDSIDVPLISKLHVTVTGAVAKPGAVEFEQGARVQKAIDLAGGALPTGDAAAVTVTHKDQSQIVVNLSDPAALKDGKINLVLQDGDSIDVPLRFKGGTVTIFGPVVNPGTYELKENWTVQDLILAAGKTTPLADLEHVDLQRAGKPIETLDLAKAAQLGASAFVPLQAGDRVVVRVYERQITVMAPTDGGAQRGLKPGQTLGQFMRELLLEQQELANTGKADLKKVTLHHGGKNIKFDVRDVVTGKDKEKQDLVLEPGDVIYVPVFMPSQRTGPLTPGNIFKIIGGSLLRFPFL
jgi:polysaccharide export outer membrane protein